MKTLFDPDLTLEEAEALIQNGANVNEQHPYRLSNTPLFMVTNLDIAKLFIANGADVNFKNIMDFTPLYYVKNVEMAKLLIEHGADIHHLGCQNHTPLFYTANIEVADFFIKNGAILNIRDIYDLSVLDYTLKVSAPQILIKYMKFLIEHGIIFGKVENYQNYRHLFTQKQQKVFDAFVSITTNDNDFFHMCLVYQEGLKNNVKMDIKEMDIL